MTDIYIYIHILCRRKGSLVVRPPSQSGTSQVVAKRQKTYLCVKSNDEANKAVALGLISVDPKSSSHVFSIYSRVNRLA